MSTGSTNTPVFRICDLVKIYPGQEHPANDQISLQIQPGEIFGLLGDNGAGKTTLVRQMVNLTASTSGEIELYGQPVGANPLQVASTVGYMPQHGQTLNNLTVFEALYFTAHLRGLGRSQSRQAARAIMETWGLTGLQDKPNTRLSGGQKRLLQIAVAMIASPPVLILDEPTNDLDPQRRKMVWDELRRLNQAEGTTIIFITHDAIEAEKIIQRVGILRDGRLAAIGKPGVLKAAVDQKLRLELFFSPEAPPDLPAGLTPRPIDADRWLVYLDRGQVNQVLNQLNMDQIDDFRLYSATLEDLYLHYANQPIPAAPADSNL